MPRFLKPTFHKFGSLGPREAASKQQAVQGPSQVMKSHDHDGDVDDGDEQEEEGGGGGERRRRRRRSRRRTMMKMTLLMLMMLVILVTLLMRIVISHSFLLCCPLLLGCRSTRRCAPTPLLCRPRYGSSIRNFCGLATRDFQRLSSEGLVLGPAWTSELPNMMDFRLFVFRSRPLFWVLWRSR